MNKEEFIGKLQMVYVGDKRASKEIISEYDRLKDILDELEKYSNQEIIEWQDVSDLWTKAQVQEDRIVLDKLKALKENNNGK